MSLDFQSIKEELDQNEKAIIHLNNKKFLVKKSNDKFKIRPVFFLIIRLVLYIISFFIPALPVATGIVLLNEIVLQGRLHKSMELTFIINITALIIINNLMRRVYTSIGNAVMNKYFKREKEKILAGLNSTEKEMPIEEFTEILEDLLEIQEDDEDKINKFNAILNKAEQRINDIENEQ